MIRLLSLWHVSILGRIRMNDLSFAIENQVMVPFVLVFPLLFPLLFPLPPFIIVFSHRQTSSTFDICEVFCVSVFRRELF